METMRNIDKILFDYLWDKKPHKIKKEVAIKPKAEGGLAMVDINKKIVTLKLTWTKRIIEGKENKIYSILENYLKYDIKLILKCTISAFWTEILRHWCNYNYLEPESVKEPGKEIIWLNSNIKFGNKLFLLKELYKKNIMSINDLLSTQENKIATFTEFQGIIRLKYHF